MTAKTKIKTPVKSGVTPGEEKPKRNFLLAEFSALSLIAFIIIGYVVVSAVRPSLEGHTIKDKRDTTVVFANRYANQLLGEGDFSYPLTSEQEERMEQFIDSLSLRGVVRIFITDSGGIIIYARPEESIGVDFSNNPDVKFALERLRATARFEDIGPEEQEALGLKEAFVQAVPITFGTSEDAAGVLYIVSRVGLLKKQISETQKNIAVRVIGGLLFLYTILFVIVWRASRTIRRQAGELGSYAGTLERRVVERTRELIESTKKRVDQAEELARLKDEFVFVAAHELQAPITRLRWILDSFFSTKELQEKATPAMVDIMDKIQTTSDGLRLLVFDLLNVARLESGTITVSVHPTDLISVIQNLVLGFKEEAKKKGISLTFDYDSTKKFPFAMSDSERLKEVFNNLIANALKFNSAGGKVGVSVEWVGDFLETKVSDTGMGMTEKELSQLFTKFWRGHPEIEGTGLGLWIAKQLITRMKGEMTVESKRGEGSVFTVLLPVAKKRGIREAKPLAEKESKSGI